MHPLALTALFIGLLGKPRDFLRFSALNAKTETFTMKINSNCSFRKFLSEFTAQR